MCNISKERREKFISFLETLKSEMKDNEENIKIINLLENELYEKKYGLVFEEHSEKVDEMLKDNIPVFSEDKDKCLYLSKEKKLNFLIEGDNLHCLYLLQKTHKNRIDVIYIDPPYNTGSGDFKYNDKFINNDDGYRHSKRLSFMKKRLIIARSLLSSRGAIFISIDDNEQANLKLLCDEIFGENNFLANLIVTAAPAGTQSSVDFAQQHAYCLCYRKSEKFHASYIKLTDDELNKKYSYGLDEGGNYYVERLFHLSNLFLYLLEAGN